MDFYAYQAAARRQSRLFVLIFVAAVAAVVFALDVVIFTALAARAAGAQYGGGEMLGPLEYAQRNPDTAIGVSLLIVAVIAVASLFKSLELRGGGAVVARSVGGVRVERDSADPARQRLRNIIEEMAIASGVPVPEIYVLEQEPGINAFAAGQTPANAAITVTHGALEQLNRDELQGVIGHEFSHILNGDMRLNVQLMGAIFGLLVIGVVGRLMLSFAPRGGGDRDRRGGGGVWLGVGLAVMVLGYIGLLAGRILQAAVSRQRERLADASAVQFTRSTEGLKGAFLKIAALEQGSHLVATDAEQVAHMLFAPGLERIFATHPPLLERIRELDPQFDPRELERIAAAGLPPGAGNDTGAASGGEGAVGGGVGPPGAAAGGAGAQGRAARIFAGPAAWAGSMAGTSGAGAARGPSGAGPGAATVPGAGAGQAAPAAGAGQAPAAVASGTGSGAHAMPGVAVQAGAVAAQVARPGSAQVELAQQLREQLPPSLRDFADSGSHARALVLALLLSRDAAVRRAQAQLIAARYGGAALAAINAAAVAAGEVAPMLRLPALLQLFPTLRRLPLQERQQLAKAVADLIHLDPSIDVFEFCLAKLLETLLNDEMSAQAPHGRLTLPGAAQAVHVLFATLARCGSDEEEQIRAAYEAGIRALLPQAPAYSTYDDWPQRTSEALSVLEQLQPQAKQQLIEGLVRTIASDNVLKVEESELLRTTCALLHCPLPLLNTGGG